VSEMSLGELIYYISRCKADFVGIPVFPSRMFRHGFIFCRKALALQNPAELSGKKKSAFCAGCRPQRSGCAVCSSMSTEFLPFLPQIRLGTLPRCIIGTLTLARSWSRGTVQKFAG